MKTPRGIRNNNPGNLDKGSPWQGLVANPDEPRFARLKTLFGGFVHWR